MPKSKHRKKHYEKKKAKNKKLLKNKRRLKMYKKQYKKEVNSQKLKELRAINDYVKENPGEKSLTEKMLMG